MPRDKRRPFHEVPFESGAAPLANGCEKTEPHAACGQLEGTIERPVSSRHLCKIATPTTGMAPQFLDDVRQICWWVRDISWKFLVPTLITGMGPMRGGLLTAKGVWGTKSTRVKTGQALARSMLASHYFFQPGYFYSLFQSQFFNSPFTNFTTPIFQIASVPTALLPQLNPHPCSLAAQQPTRRDESHPFMRRAENVHFQKTKS